MVSVSNEFTPGSLNSELVDDNRLYQQLTAEEWLGWREPGRRNGESRSLRGVSGTPGAGIRYEAAVLVRMVKSTVRTIHGYACHGYGHSGTVSGEKRPLIHADEQMNHKIDAKT